MVKPGDRYPVTMEGIVIAYAEVTEVEEGQVWLSVPATNFLMAVETTLVPKENERESVIIND